MKQDGKQKGFSAVIAVILVMVIAALGLGGWYVWDKNRKDDGAKKSDKTSQTNESENGGDEEQNDTETDETADWVSVTTQGKAFSMKVPDGWALTNYPNDFLGALETVYKPGTPAAVENSSAEYIGHSLRFRASVAALDDAGLGPQWASPQPGLEETTQDFSIGTLQGKRFKGVFSADLNQTLYEYVFDLGHDKKLDIVYTVYHDDGEKDDVNTVEKAIKTIDLNN